MDEQTKVRFDKLASAKERGFNFPNDVRITHKSTEVKEIASSGDESTECKVAGRVMAIRMMGKAAFIQVKDMHSTLQVYVRKDRVGDEQYADFKSFDIGDLVEVSGTPFLTKTEEPSLKASSVRLLVKCLHPLPEKWHGLSDVEVRYRKRYLDLIVNDDSFKVFILRSKIIQKVREFFVSKGYVEVETQMMNPVVSGAAARPFETHHNALNLDLNLRIALELPLKKMLVGGIEKVFEIGRVFRNEGISTQHNPEFTMIEFYEAYSTYEDLMDLSQELLQTLCDDVIGSRTIQHGDQEISFDGDWERISMIDAIYKYAKVESSEDLKTLAGVKKVASSFGLDEVSDSSDYGKILSTIFEEKVEHHLVNPTFITQFPLSVSPLSRKNSSNPEFVDRFELYVCGMELANAFSELNDAGDQMQRFEDQIRQKHEGDEEAMSLDEDFINALEYGMPPAAGQGIGIDRLVMLLTGSHSIRDVILFPQMKPTTSDE